MKISVLIMLTVSLLAQPNLPCSPFRPYNCTDAGGVYHPPAPPYQPPAPPALPPTTVPAPSVLLCNAARVAPVPPYLKAPASAPLAPLALDLLAVDKDGNPAEGPPPGVQQYPYTPSFWLSRVEFLTNFQCSVDWQVATNQWMFLPTSGYPYAYPWGSEALDRQLQNIADSGGISIQYHGIVKQPK